MMLSKVLEISRLCKEYPAFKLDNVSFSIEKGTIMGFIGRNGAGKSTTLKSVLNLVHPTAGSIKYFGTELKDNEDEIKQRVGFAGGAVDYYKRRKIADIVKVTKTFFDNWDDEAYKKYMQMFSLDENKKPMELSEGMKVKFNIVLALSHGAELLILDEPTSGLDPVSRDELLEVFLKLAKQGVSILFSTHITSDLDKCADEITYIKCGKIVESKSLDAFIDEYVIVDIGGKLTPEQENAVIGECSSRKGTTALVKEKDKKLFEQYECSKPNLEEIMVHFEKGDINE